MLKHKTALLLALTFATTAHAQSTKSDIYQLAITVQNEIFNSQASENELQRARADLQSVVARIRGMGGQTGGNQDIYCKNINNTQWYAPARVSDQAWLEDNGTDLARCQQQINSARFGLLCSRIRDTQYYAPLLISNLEWRGDNGTDYATCERQVLNARPTIFCQHVRDTQYYAAARILTGEWLQANGASLDECFQTLGGIQGKQEAVSTEPTTPDATKSAP